MVGPNDEPKLTAEEAAYDARETALLDRLGEAGWQFAGGSDPQAGTTHIGIGLDPEVRRLTLEEALPHLPITDDEGTVVAGYEVGTNEDTGQFELSYDGPLDERFERVVGALVGLVKPPEAPQVSLEERLDEWAGYERGQTDAGVARIEATGGPTDEWFAGLIDVLQKVIKNHPRAKSAIQLNLPHSHS